MIQKQQITSQSAPISQVYRVDDIPLAGVSGVIDLNSDEKSEIAKIFDITELKKFKFTYNLMRGRQGRFKLDGQLEADVTQECVITLEPVEKKYNDTIVIDLWPPKDVALAEKLAEQEGRSFLLDGPEPIVDDQIDVGQIAYEHFASILDPFPKKAGAAFDWSGNSTDDTPQELQKPFAGLDDMLRKKAGHVPDTE